jgi:hypothetical protein
MAITALNTIKNWFKTGLKPTQNQFWDTWDSFRHKFDKVPVADIEGIDDLLNGKASKTVLDDHLTNDLAHTPLFNAKEDKNQKGAVNGYAPLDEFIKIASQYLTIVDNLVTGGHDSLLSAEQGKILKTQIDAINILLTSNDVNLDTVQEIVDAIKTVQTSLNTILVNDLTTGGTTKALTAEMGKTLKGLIDALTTSISGKMSTIITTVKTITSANLTTQDAAGFVAYVNTLGAPLVVGANEIVEYQLSDTGRVFKLLLRGRSFGTGQPAITAADVEEVTLWMNKDLKFSNYPSTRNDGQLPTNKVLAPDVNGNIKLYTMATMPAPYIDELIPDSYLPNATGNIRILGSYFTPTMCDRINNANAIILNGVSTIHYAVFVSNNEILINVTTGSVEGIFSCTLNNGLSTTKNNALLIVLGTVHKINESDFTSVSPFIDIEDGVVTFNTFGDGGSIKAFSGYKIPANKNFRLTFQFIQSKLGYNTWDRGMYISLLKSVDSTLQWQSKFHYGQYSSLEKQDSVSGFGQYDTINGFMSLPALGTTSPSGIVTMERVAGVMKWLAPGGSVSGTSTSTYNGELVLSCGLINAELIDFKYIELAT